jgi:hypothetical protein
MKPPCCAAPHFRVAHASRVLVAVFHRDELLSSGKAEWQSLAFSKVREVETRSPARETRALPGASRR